MGRGAETEQVASDAIRSRSSAREDTTSSERQNEILNLAVLQKRLNSSMKGETIRLANGEVIVLGDDDPSFLMHGLSLLESVDKKDDGTFLVRFSDGEEALVDLQKGAVSLMLNANDSERASSALYAALGSGYLDILDPEDREYSDTLNEFLRAKALYSDNPSVENFRDYAKALESLGDISLEDDIDINPDNFAFEDDQQPDFTIEQMAYEQRHRAVLDALRSSDPEGNMQKVLFGADAEGEAYEILPSKYKERVEAAKELNAPIPAKKSLPTEPLLDDKGRPVTNKDGEIVMDENSAAYIMGKQELDTMDRVLMMTAMGSRFFTHRGPPGCGKDTFWKEFAAYTDRPYELLSFGPEARIEEAIGGADFETVIVKEERVVPVLDKDGFHITDEEGKKKYETKTFEVAAGMMLTEKLGRFSELAKKPSMIVITEPEGAFAEGLVRLNKAFGDDYGDPTGRTFYVNSTEGKTHEVHPDCVIAITHNMDDQDGDEQRPRESTTDRAENIEWNERPPDEDAKILAAIARNQTRKHANASQSEAGEEIPALFPGMTSITPTADDLMPVAQLMSTIRNSVEQNGGQGDFVSGIEMRRAIAFYDRYRANAYMQGVAYAEAEAHKSLLQLLDATQTTAEERRNIVEEFIEPTLLALSDQGQRYHAAAKEYVKKHNGDVNFAARL